MNPYLYGVPPFFHPFYGVFVALVFIVLAVSYVLKGYALWHSARNHQTGWFIGLLIIQTLGILDAVYLLFFREDKSALAARVAPPPVTPPVDSSSPEA